MRSLPHTDLVAARQVFAACSSAPDARILRCVEAYFAAHHAGDVEDFVEWIQDQPYSRSPNTGAATAPSPVSRS